MAVNANRARRRARELSAPPEPSVRVGRPTRTGGSRWVSPPDGVRAALDDAGVAADPARVWTAWLVGATLATAAGTMAGGAGLGCLAAVVSVGAPSLALRARRGRGAARVEAQLPMALEAVARSLRSGASLRQAVVEAASVGGPVGDDLAGVAVGLRGGVTLAEALERWEQQRPLPGVRLAVAALSLASETGGAQARAVDGVAATLRDRQAVAAEVRAQAAQVRASVLVISVAPIAFCAFASATDHRTAQFLFRTPLGWAFLAVGLGLDALSAVWMRRLSRIAP
jgi:tight adherence protein B